MKILTYILVYAGSALMVYNIIRYGMFVKSSAQLEKKSSKTGLLIVPLLLLIFFLIGYIIVGVTRLAELSIIIPLILFGGSVFVFLLLTVMFSIIARIRETDRVLALRYEEMKEQVEALGKRSLSAFLVNLTNDTIVARSGEYLYDSDLEEITYSGMLSARSANVIEREYSPETSDFLREKLIDQYLKGHTTVSEIILARRKDDVPSYVILEAELTKMPVSGDIVALISEKEYNEEIVKNTLLEKVMTDEYDRIAYIIGNRYRILLKNDSKKEGILLPPDPEGDYESFYYNYVLPSMIREPGSGPNPMRLSVVEAELEKNDFYEVDSLFNIDGRILRKHIRYYTVDRNAKFYVMLITDVTRISDDLSGNKEKIKKETPTPSQDFAVSTKLVPATSAPVEEKDGESVPLLPLRILLVEDNPINIDMAEMILTSEGWEVTKATNGAEAVKAVSSADPGRFDIVLMDVNMPVMNGYEATAAIRALPDKEKSSVPILAVTANSFEEDRKTALDAGMNGQVSKPIDPDEIRAAAKKLVPGFADNR